MDCENEKLWIFCYGYALQSVGSLMLNMTMQVFALNFHLALTHFAQNDSSANVNFSSYILME